MATAAAAEMGEGWWWFCWLGKQDFMSHEKCRELQVLVSDDMGELIWIFED